MTRALVFFAITALTLVTTGVPLAGCPFLQGNAETERHDCCPRPQKNTCPLSTSLETCPYYVTDSKLGIAQANEVAPLLVSAEIQSPEALYPVETVSIEDTPPDGSGLHLRNRVLRI